VKGKVSDSERMRLLWLQRRSRSRLLCGGGGIRARSRGERTPAVFGGGKVIGVIPRHLVDLEVAHTRLSDLRVVDSMHQRKQMLADRELLLVGEDPDVLLTALDTHVLPATPKWIDRTTT
jgi:predicted Rossmann-fold nucleotide-binding protein